jgi:asparagine synthase (glutamine-hydrolysing)
MCGLAGIFAYSHHAPAVDSDELLRIREQMIRRGPDGAGLWLSPDQRVGLAHRRLAIIDLTPEAAQPMASADGRYQIVFNGEIYNYRELREDLQRSGAVFRSQSDTEVLLQLYAKKGNAMCRQLRGMYAFAIWDSHEQCLFLARDPFGIKPMYVSDDGVSFRFASQVKALLAGGAIARQPDPVGQLGFWIWGAVPEPHTWYEGIRAFPPGTTLEIHLNGRRQCRAFEAVADMLNPDVADGRCERSLQGVLFDSVRHHLIADVPVGVFLSAGIDSATLTAAAAACDADLSTVTLGFDEYRGTAADETVLAEAVSRRYGTKHQTVWVRQSDFESALEAFLDAMDQPSIDGLNTWFVARAAAQVGLKVAITGLGGDEFFGGYPSFRHVPRIRHVANPFGGVPGFGRLFRQLTAGMLSRLTSAKYAGLFEYGSTWEGAYMLRRAVRMPWELASAAPHGSWTTKPEIEEIFGQHASPGAVVSYLEATRYMRNQLLRDADWAGMAHSIELRVPLVDRELVRFVGRQRREGKALTKQDLAATATPALPTELIKRAKTGFTVPVREWMLRSGGERVAERGLRGWQAFVAEVFPVEYAA